jgi:hypothetical protein
MKRYVLMILLLLGCLGAHAQKESKTLVSLNKTNLEGLTEYNGWTQFDHTQEDFSIDVEPEGLAITNPRIQAEIWQPQVMVVPDGSFDLEEGHDYIVRLTIKAPSDGTYQVNIGSWFCNDVGRFSVKANLDFQIVDVEFPEYKGNVAGGHVLLQVGWVEGTTVVKEVEVLEIVSDGTASIMASKAVKADDVMYNLAGQRVDASYKGVVIQNGKKRMK